MPPLLSTTPEMDALEREIVDHVFVLQPGYGVALGLHQYDGIVPDLSDSATAHWADQADRLLQRLAAVSDGRLSADRKIDAFLLRLLLESPLFDVRESRDLDRNPMSYVGSISLTAYLVRDYAPLADRVRSILKTLESVPQLLDDGRRRLAGPLPRPFVELSLAIGGGLPAHFGEAETFAARAGLAREVHAARQPAEAAVARFLGWLKEEELPRAIPEFALGPERYHRLLFVREGIEAPVEDMRKAGAEDLARNQARLDEIARDEKVAVAELFHRLALDHPTAEEVVSTANACVEETRSFVREKDLVTIPEPVQVRVEETPVWGRALSTASMNSPGPFDTGPEGVYYVTPVDPKWTPVQQEEWLRSLNRTMLRNITVHEVFPGHYLQFLHFRVEPGEPRAKSVPLAVVRRGVGPLHRTARDRVRPGCAPSRCGGRPDPRRAAAGLPTALLHRPPHRGLDPGEGDRAVPEGSPFRASSRRAGGDPGHVQPRVLLLHFGEARDPQRPLPDAGVPLRGEPQEVP